MLLLTSLLAAVCLATAQAGIGNKADASGPDTIEITDGCLACLCINSNNNCSVSYGCRFDEEIGRDYCGPFYQSLVGWQFGGRPYLEGDDPDRVTPDGKGGAGIDCLNDLACAAQVIRNKVIFNGRVDCNLDGQIDCFDHNLVLEYGDACTNPNAHAAMLQKPRYQNLPRCVNQLNLDPNEVIYDEDYAVYDGEDFV